MKRVYIDPQHRGQQLGEKLLAALEAKARQREDVYKRQALRAVILS